ncbi:MAG: hypothetical protein IPF53_08845 [Blastocatellia bacterium]|jgi:hypothetical protein|nr:hypothetical protein [Blastocatellia bacterium]MBK6427335.1 hypothetical protein [Blastocatellia bacterium]
MRFPLPTGIRQLTTLLVAFSLFTLPLEEARAATTVGPGPFANVRVTPNGLLMTLRGSTSVFTGEPRVEVSGGGPWIAFDRRATVKGGGSQLLQKGLVAGVSAGEYFPQNESRRVRIRNGDGGLTELDLVRTGDGFLIAWTNRTPSKAKRLASSNSSTVDALSDRTVTVRPSAGDEAKFDIVVTVTNPTLPPDANYQSVSLLAESVSTGETYDERSTFRGDGRVTFHHILLPAGTYEIRAFRTVNFGNALTFLSSVSQRIVIGDLFTVGRDSRHLSISIPDVPVPQAVSTTFHIGGLDAFAPSVSNRVTVGLQLFSVFSLDGSASLFADREVSSGDPVSIEAQLPPGDYAVALSAGSKVDGSSNTSVSVPLGRITITSETRLDFPALARFSGTILDPDFELFSDATFPGDVSQAVSLSSTVESIQFSSRSSLFGFSRGFQARVPVGGEAFVNASIALEASRNGAGGNRFGRLDFKAIASPIAMNGDVEVDFPVPDLPGFVTLSCIALDRNGEPSTNSSVFVTGSDVDGLPNATYTASTTTDRNGSFTLHVLRGRAYRIFVHTPTLFEF